MGDTSFNQRDQKVETQYNAGTIIIQQGDRSASEQAVVKDALPPPRGRLLGSAPPHTPVFTGREQELHAIHTLLQTENVALTPAPAALHGMGGVGKTQTAREYVRLHQAEYAVVLWVSGETLSNYAAQLASLAPDLSRDIPVSNDQQATYTQVKRWLEANGEWLLVVDNAENLDALRSLLPEHRTGRVLLTTRETVPTNFARSIEIEYMDDDTGATLLLRRAGIIQPDQRLTDADPQTQAEAKAVSAELGGLVLALAVAGAYVHERGITVAKYREFYAKRRRKLHAGNAPSTHDPVTLTFSLALERLEAIPKTGKAAAALVLMCAFLAPDVIPDEIFLQGAEHLEPELAQYAADEIEFTDVIATVCRYSLLLREGDPPGLWMHRLAQEVIRDTLTADEQKAMRERTVLAVNAAFPVPEYETWELCERLLPHALLCEIYFDQDFLYIAQSACLFDKTAQYLQHRARYADAERIFRQALGISQRVHGNEHPDIADIYNNLGRLLIYRGLYKQAEEALKCAIAIDRNTITDNDPRYANHLGNLARAYYYQGDPYIALPLARQALDIVQRHYGAEHYEVTEHINTLATVFHDMGNYEEAVKLRLMTLETGLKTIGKSHPNYAKYLQNLASTYLLWNKPEQAEEPLQEALLLYIQQFGTEHPFVASCYSWIGHLRIAQGLMAEAAEYFERTVEIQERVLGHDHQHTQINRYNLVIVRGRM